MEVNRIPVKGTFPDNSEKRAMDLLLIDGQVVVETIDHRTGCRVKTPLDKVLTYSKQLKKIQKPNVTI